MKLNHQQHIAVKAIEGPVITIAGPGTGKTQLLSGRVAQILKDTDLLPENILCLTFTDAAIIAMHQRLKEIMGVAAHRVAIYTFHSFCQKVIADYQFEMNVLSLEPISDLESVEYYHKIIDAFDANNPLKNYKLPYIDTKNLSNLNQLLKQERLSKEDLFLKIEDKIRALDNDETLRYKRKFREFNKGDLNPSLYQNALQKLEKLKAAIDACYQYREMMSKTGRYDFDDMILWVLDFLKNNEFALLKYQEQYQYIMVDEYQDTNKAQNDLILLLASYWDVPNLMVVGDDDQSIFRFQGANIENLNNFVSKYSDQLLTVTLNENYRSSQIILDAGSYVIQKNLNRLVQNKNLVARKNPSAYERTPTVVECKNILYESAYVVNKIEEALEKGIPPSEIAVIYRTHKQSETLQSYLSFKNIPFYLKKRSNIFHLAFINNLIELLEYIKDEKSKPYSGEWRLFKILHFDFWEISSFDLAKLAYTIKQKGMKWRDVLNTLQEDNALIKIIGDDSIKKLQKFTSDLEYWIVKSHNLTLQELVEKVISKGGILSHILQSVQKKLLLQALQTLFDFLKDQTRLKPELTLDAFLRNVSLMKENKIALEAEEIIEKGEGIQLLTAHASKGLEFELVIVLGCNEEFYDKTIDRLPFSIREIIVPGTTDSLLEENRRLFYVACTRAKSDLCITYNQTNLNLKNLMESVFVTEFMESGLAELTKAEISENQMLEVQVALFNKNHDEKNFELMDDVFLSQYTENFVLSSTNLDNYLECPVKFYYRNLLHIPSAKSAPLSFGNAIHFALEMFFKNMLKHPEKKYPGLQQLKTWFKFELDKHADTFIPEDFSRALEYGQLKVLPQLYNTFLPEWEQNKNREPEKNLSNIVVNEVPIKGKVDQLLFLDPHLVHVIDFKTGKINSRKKNTLKAPVIGIDPHEAKFEELYGGNYWRQIAFYHLLLNNDKLHKYQTVSGEMFFVEPDDSGRFYRETIKIHPEEFIFMENLIKEVYTKIKNHEFSEGCQKPDCEWCNFNKFYLNKKIYSSENLMSDSEEN